MPRALVLGNGETLVCLDKFGFVRDFYFPYVGLENHVSGNKHRIGVWVDGQFSWLDDGSWSVKIAYKPETMVGYLVCKNENLQLSIVMEDCVYNEANVFLRQVDVYNHQDQVRNVRVFFHQVFMIAENKKRNTAFFDPTHNAIVHYRGRRLFIVNGRTSEGKTMDDFAVGSFNFEGKMGTYKDAEDGELGKNGVEHGSVDSTIRFCITCEGKKKATLHYWICAAKTLDDVYALNSMVMNKTPEGMLHSTEDFWHAWLDRQNYAFDFLTPDQKKLFNTSLFILRAHADNRGSIIASADSAMIEYGKDDYAYMWPRDAAFIVSALDSAGFHEVTKNFFLFCQNVLHEDGYLHHRFNSDQSLGSTWHSPSAQFEWLKDKKLQLPIQEDETASVIFALWHHYQVTKDIEFIEDLFKPFIEKAADFLVDFRNKTTMLPMPSYDLWEEVIGISTYTCASVYGGLMAAANFAELLGKRNHMRKYKQAAKEIKKATIDYLFSEQQSSFVRFAKYHEDKVEKVEVVDASSLFGLWYFGMFDQADPYFQKTHEQVMKRLQNPGATAGFIRYENDAYFRSGNLSNPWFITTLWEVERRLAAETVNQEDLDYARDVFAWIEKHQYLSGVLAEQLDPETGTSESATPLVWSHAEFVRSVLLYHQALVKLKLVEIKTPESIFHEL